MAAANILWVLRNAYITTGKVIRKRPCLTKIATLESGTVGLKSAGGKLNTFYGGTGTAITHANPLFLPNRVIHPSSTALAATKAHYGETFNGFLYCAIEYSDGSIKHHYLDDGAPLTFWTPNTTLSKGTIRQPTTPNGRRYEITDVGATHAPWTAVNLETILAFRRPTVSNGLRYQKIDVSIGVALWAATTVYVLNSFVRPTVGNTLRYEATTAGTSGATEPVWPTTAGATVVDGTVTWTCRNTGVSGATEPTWPTTAGLKVNDGNLTWLCVDSHTTGATEPIWSTSIGATVGDGPIIWTVRGTAIGDPNCPNTKQVKKLLQKIYAQDGADVAFCKTADPRDWTATLDAGTIPAGINASGSDTVTAIGDFKGDLGVFFSDSLQVWDIDSDPTLNALKSSADSIGTIHSKSPQALAGDLIFLAKPGFRSLSLVAITDNLQENDVGSAIDAFRSEISDSDDPIAIYYPNLGQLWEINGSRAYVYSFSRSVKLSAWSIFDFPITVDDAAVLSNELYLRSGNDVYKVDPNAYSDNGSIPLVEVEMYYQDNQAPGVGKQFIGFDGVVRGSPEIAFRYDTRNTNLITPYYPISGDMRPGDLFPMEIVATSIAPVFRHQADEEFQVDQLLCHYEKLGV
jgi:hypothetical protein